MDRNDVIIMFSQLEFLRISLGPKCGAQSFQQLWTMFVQTWKVFCPIDQIIFL